MPRFPVLKPREVLRALIGAGFYIDHQTGSHARLFHATRPELRVTIPIHNKDLPIGTLKRIIRQAGSARNSDREQRFLERADNSASILDSMSLNASRRFELPPRIFLRVRPSVLYSPRSRSYFEIHLAAFDGSRNLVQLGNREIRGAARRSWSAILRAPLEWSRRSR
ncbi:MAG: type II toxin-antitoxin system HicA family toxin [Bryobacteraceae bacterium]